MACNNESFQSGFTAEGLTALEKAIAGGIRTVRYGDKEVTYATMKDMLAARLLMRRHLKLEPVASGTIFGRRRRIGVHTKGLE